MKKQLFYISQAGPDFCFIYSIRCEAGHNSMKPFSYIINDAIAINLEGEFDTCVVAQQRDDFENFSRSKKDVVVDLTDVYFIDSSGIGAIVFLYKRLICQQHHLSIVGLSGQPKDLFEMLHLDKTLACFDSIEEFIQDRDGDDKAGFNLEKNHGFGSNINDIKASDFYHQSH